MTIIYFTLAGIGAVIAFIVSWLVAEVFIFLRAHWSKRRYVIFTIKLVMTVMATFAPMVLYTSPSV